MMKIKFERKEKIEKPTKKEKVPTIKVGTHNKLVIGLWAILVISLVFGVYKNFTAIDTHTIHEKEIIEKQVVDTNKVESFVTEFAKEYFSWQQSQEAIDNRNERLQNYLTENLQQLNVDMIRADIPTSSIVSNVQIWSVSQADDTTFNVLFSVTQQITENENKKNTISTYNVSVHVDKSGNMVIIKNPTIDNKPKKSEYQPQAIENDGTVDATMSDEITDFLDTFFKLYPTATEKELSYYVQNNALPTINKDYVFSEIVSQVYTMKDNEVTAIVTVKYLDQETKAVQLSQFNLKLQKQDNWKIVV